MLFWFEKGEKKFAKRQSRTRVDRVKMSATHILPSAPVKPMTIDHLVILTILITGLFALSVTEKKNFKETWKKCQLPQKY